VNPTQVRARRPKSRSQGVRGIVFCTQEDHVAGLALLAIHWPVSTFGHNRRDAGRDLAFA
jgi:hypothetical protein